MSDVPILYPKWEGHLFSAINEPDPARMVERVRDVEDLLAARLDKISGSRAHSAELEAIEDAMDVLEVLKRRANRSKAS